MGFDHDRARAEYWATRALGYTDEEIIAMDEWPTRPKEPTKVYDESGRLESWSYDTPPFVETPAMKARRHGVSPHPDPKNVPPRKAKTVRINKIKREMGMINRTRVIDDLKAAIAKAQKELALLERIPAEPAERLTTFVVTFNGSKPYTYVALRVDGEWIVSGRHFDNSRWTWSGIFARFEEINARVCYIATPTEYRHETVHH
jgi:hypothetical protein